LHQRRPVSLRRAEIVDDLEVSRGAHAVDGSVDGGAVEVAGDTLDGRGIGKSSIRRCHDMQCSHIAVFVHAEDCAVDVASGATLGSAVEPPILAYGESAERFVTFSRGEVVQDSEMTPGRDSKYDAAGIPLHV